VNFTASTTNYIWFVNGAEISEASGIGKDTYHFVASDARLIIIKVTVDPGSDFESVSQSVPFQAQDYSGLQNLGGGGAGTGSATGGGGGITTGGFGTPNSFNLESSDDNPVPNENITVTLRSYSFDQSITRIRWSVNGATVQGPAIGLTSYSFTAGKIGSRYSIRATALLDDGTAAAQTIVLNVSDIQFYWWANTYTPKWYQGKALPVVGSPVYVYAIPEAANVNPKTAIYKWSMNDSVLPASSGQGKSVFQFTPQFSGVSERITVSIKNTAGESIGEKTISITPTVPQVNVYALKPLEGIAFNQTGNAFGSKPEEFADFIAEPFYFGVKTISDLMVTWSFNNQPVTQTPARPNIFGIQAPKGFISDQFVSVQISNPKQKNESAAQSFTVNYNRTQ
ncbi:hypothetical protein KGQ34_02405, partial [Patescibacteria group bacterium]|nr:hypothetical protein [Patescibacteria group bacterium]